MMGSDTRETLAPEGGVCHWARTAGGCELQLVFTVDGHPSAILAIIQRLLRRRFRCAVALDEYRVAGTALTARLTLPLPLPAPSVQADLERLLSRLTVPWGVRVRRGLQQHCGALAEGLWATVAAGISDDYRNHMHPRFARRDLQVISSVASGGGERFALWGPFPSATGPFYRLQHYASAAVSLNSLLPLLANLDLTVEAEHDFAFPLTPHPVALKSFVVRGVPAMLPLAEVRTPLLELLSGVRAGQVENDLLNRILLACALDWQQIDVFRGYRNYLQQLRIPFAAPRFAQALVDHPLVTRLLWDYFEARFAPGPLPAEEREEQTLFPLRQQLAAALETVNDAAADRILRILFNLIDATVRSNFFLRREKEDYFFAFKISALGIIDMPAPRPLYEIYVHAATMEGIHLRGGMVARGGIRWSDRPDDFRSEILALMKTQMVKNVVIVPVGSKGGFVLKGGAGSGTDPAQRVVNGYRLLIRGLLDLTDNRLLGRVVHPAGIVAYDGDDPYLVVAADKGTAHFSDTANALSRDYGFWLDDAFASGGSHGYDHKALAITARGAWECVAAHFAELGRDLQREPVSVVGIGDMSGDVFGNGMLRSRRIRLLAAFDHRHIFLDPDPDPAASYVERERLFQLPRSSWDDYDRGLISPGGGVFPRDAKEIPLSPQLQQWLGVRHPALDPAGLIRLLLTAPVDLLWNGGIGTYAKASGEKHEEVCDRANDALRVDGGELRALVVGEGGNLGFTQRGRIEYALRGGRINTDAVDNSAGVDCSDHEVNLKIFMQHLAEAGVLTDRSERDRLLTAVTDEVCAQVLEDNRQQSLCLSLDALRCRADCEPFLALTKRLEGSGLLDRQGEALPDAGVVAARPEPVLTRPELAVLMAYAKMQLYQQFLDSSLPDDPAAAALLHGYFPSLLRERFAAQLSGHPLARELTATVMANRIVNQAGATAIFALARETGAPPATVAASYLALDGLLAGDVLRAALAQAGTQLPAAERLALLLQLEETLAGLCLDSLNAPVPLTLADSERLAPRVAAFRALPRAATALESAAEARLLAAGLAPEPVRLARDLGYFPDLLVLLDLAGSGELSPAATALAAVRESLALATFVELTNQVPLRDEGDRRALRTLRRGIRMAAVDLARQLLASGDDGAALLAARPALLSRFQGELARLSRLPAPRLSTLFALLHDLDDLVAVRHPGR